MSQGIENKKIRKYFRYIELYILFPFVLVRTRLKYSIQRILIVDHSDAMHLFYFRKNCGVTIVHDQFAFLAAKSKITDVNIRFLGRIYQGVIHLGLKRSGGFIAVSESTKKVLIDLELPQQIKVLNLTWLPWESEKDEKIRDISLDNKYDVLVSPSSWRKDRILAINTINELKKHKNLGSLELLIVGDCLTRQENEKLHLINLDFVKFVNKISNAEMKLVYEKSLFCIATSKYEGLGLPIIEANSVGKVCVHNQIPSFLEITNRNNIVIKDNFDENDWPLIANKINKFSLSRELATSTELRFGFSQFQLRLRSHFLSQ